MERIKSGARDVGEFGEQEGSFDFEYKANDRGSDRFLSKIIWER